MKLLRINNVFVKEDGFTITELIVVVAIVAILAGIVGMNTSSWLGKARVEEQVKRMYSDLTTARMRAMTHNRLHFVRLNTVLNRYQVWDDTSPGPDGSLAVETADDRLLVQVDCRDQLSTDLGGEFNFNTKGFASLDGTVRIVSTYEPGVDCIVVSSTRIRIGRWDGATCIPK
jgi:prepilin-type N-terminal cleavage/methylation domain-containing protein